MAAGDNFKVSIIGQESVYGSAIVNDFGLADVGSSAHLDTVAIAAAFQTMIEAKLLACLPQTYSLLKYRCACVAGPHQGEIGFVINNSPPQGGGGNTSLPTEMAISIRRSTGYASRRDRGRIFLGPVDLGQFVDPYHQDQLSASIGPLLTFAGCLASSITVSGTVLSPVILASNGTYSGNLVIHTQVASTFVHRRSRRAGIGA